VVATLARIDRPRYASAMKLPARYRIVIEGQTAPRYTGDDGKTRAYLIERLLSGQDVAEEALASEGVRVSDASGLVERARLRDIDLEDAAMILADAQLSEPITAEELVGLFNVMLDAQIGEEP
jgi:hypothetical protein